MPPKSSAQRAGDAMHHFQQRRQERMRGTGASTVTESSQRFRFNLPVPPSTASALSSSSASVVPGSGRVASGARPPSDAYLFSGSTVAPGSAVVGASGSPRRVVRVPSASSSAILPPQRGAAADVTTSPVPRSALKGGRAIEARLAARMDEESEEALAEQFENEVPPDDSFRSEGMGGSPSGGEKSVSFRRPPESSSTATQRSAGGSKPTAASTSSSTTAKKSQQQSTLFRYTRVGETPQTKRTSPLPPAAVPAPPSARKSAARHSSVTAREKEARKRAREAERERERQRKEAKKAAAEVKDRNKKRKRDTRDDGDFEDDEEDEYEVEFDDEDGDAGPDVTMQENVVIGNRISKGLQKANGMMAKFMRRRVRHAIRLALEDDPEEADAALEGSANAPASAGGRRSRSAGDEVTDADVIWSLLDSELKAASTSSASTIASSTLRELRKIVRTLFEGLSIKASERRELIAQLDRARHRKKRIRKEVYQARQEVLQNQEAMERIRQTENDNANKIKSAEEGVSFLSKVKTACAGWV